MEGSSGVRKGAWTPEEDVLLTNCIQKYGEGSWHLVPSRSGLNRCRKSCRLRWLNYLKPDIKRGEFATDEIDLILRLHKLLGNRWSLIAGRLPGRTSNDVKNFWNTHIRKKFNSDHHDDKKTGNMTVIRPCPRVFTKNLCSSSLKGETTKDVHAAATAAGEDHVQPTKDQDDDAFTENKPTVNLSVDKFSWVESLLSEDLKDQTPPCLGDQNKQNPISSFLDDQEVILLNTVPTVPAMEVGGADESFNNNNNNNIQDNLQMSDYWKQYLSNFEMDLWEILKGQDDSKPQ